MSDILTDQEVHDFQELVYPLWPEGARQKLDSLFRHIVALKRKGEAAEAMDDLDKYVAFYVKFAAVVKTDTEEFLDNLDISDETGSLADAVEFIKLMHSTARKYLNEEGLKLGAAEEVVEPAAREVESLKTPQEESNATYEAQERAEKLGLMLSFLGMKGTLAAKLKKEGISYLHELVQKTEDDLMELPRFGKGKVGGVKDFLEPLGLHLGMDNYEVDTWVEQGPEEFE